MKKFTLTIFIWIPCFIYAQINFTDVTNSPVVGYGLPGEWDAGQVWNPSVIMDGDTLKMWYTGGDGSVFEGPITSIGYAWSLQGIAWNKYEENPVLTTEFEWEGDYLFGCAVIKDGDTLKMWYGASLDSSLPGKNIGYATSTDGISWEKHQTPVLQTGPESEWDDDLITPTTVIKEGAEYKMWYWAGRPGFPWEQSLPQVGLATSPDGIEWTKYDDPITTEAPYANSDPVLKVGLPLQWDELRAINPMVLKKDTGYEMWYIGLANEGPGDQLGYAQSDDGIDWEKYTGNPIFTEPLLWGYDIYGGSVLKFDGAHHLWFSCFHVYSSDPATPLIGYAYDGTVAVNELNKNNLQLQLTPNPFTVSITIEYELKQAEEVALSIFNQFGQIVYQTEENQQQGKQQIIWNAEGYVDGVYYYRLRTGEQVANGKVVKVR